MGYEKQLLINDTYVSTGDLEDNFTNFTSPFTSPNVARLTGPPRRKKVTEIVLHESVTVSTLVTIGVLKRRHLGVHFIIGPQGDVTQHGDPVLDQLAHAGWPHNAHSVGIEIVNPYYPAFNPLGTDAPWHLEIDARWAHKKRYVVPNLDQLESTYQLVKLLLGVNTPEFRIPKKWVGLDVKKKRLAMARVNYARWPVKGVMAHAAFHHADGAFPLLYCILRAECNVPLRDAYFDAMEIAKTPRWYADLTGVL